MQTRRRCQPGKWLLALFLFLTACNIGEEVVRRVIPLPVDCDRSQDLDPQPTGRDLSVTTAIPQAEHSTVPPAVLANQAHDAEALERAWQAVFGHGVRDVVKIATPKSSNAPPSMSSSAPSSA